MKDSDLTKRRGAFIQYSFPKVGALKWFWCLLISLVVTSAMANADTATSRKADFILNVANKVFYKQNIDNTTYKIGIYGKDKKTRNLFATLKEKAKTTTIRGKAIEIERFKNTRNLKRVDLFYVNGDSKIRISDLQEQFKNHPYVVITEKFPYGTSMLNFAVNVNDELFFEIQDAAIKGNGATILESLLTDPRRVTEQNNWKEKLDLANKTISNQVDTLVKKEEELTRNSEKIEHQKLIIQSQQTILFLSIAFGLVTSLLVFLLFKANSRRKETLLQLAEKNKEIVDSIHYAQRIQKAILPSEESINDALWESFVLYEPKDIVAGDFYWLEVEEESVYVSVADCTGHGVPGAMLSVICSKLLTKTVKELKLYEPSKILDSTVTLLEERFSRGGEKVSDGMDLGLCRINFSKMTIEYSGANNPLYYIRNGELNVIKPDKQPIGAYPKRSPYTNTTLEIKPGDCLYMLTDGYIDQFGGEKGKKFKSRPFRNLLIEHHKKPMEEQKRILQKTIKDWQGDLEQVDDICVMGIRIRSSE